MMRSFLTEELGCGAQMYDTQLFFLSSCTKLQSKKIEDLTRTVQSLQTNMATISQDLKETKELGRSNAFDINSREYITRLQNILSRMLISLVPNGKRGNRTTTSTSTSTSPTGILVFRDMRLFKFLNVWEKDNRLKK